MKKPLVLYFVSEVFLSTGIGICVYVLPFLYKSGGLTDAEVGELFAVNTVTSGVCALLLGPVADRFGASRVVKLATLLVSAGYLVTAMADRMSLWYLTAVLIGVGAALLVTTENVVLSALTKNQEKAGLLSRFLAMYTFVMAVGALIAGPLSTMGSYRSTMYIGAAIALVSPIIRFFVRVQDVKAERMFRLPSKKLLAMCGYALIFGAGMGLFNPFATLILKGNFGLSDNVVSATAAASTFMTSLGAFAVSPLLRHLKHERTLLLSFVVSIGATVVLGMTGHAFGFASMYLLRTTSTSVPGPIVDAAFLNLTSATEYAQMFGVRVFGNNVGTAAGSYSGGWLLSGHGVLWIYLGSAGLFMLAYLYLQVLMRKIRSSSVVQTASDAMVSSTN